MAFITDKAPTLSSVNHAFKLLSADCGPFRNNVAFARVLAVANRCDVKTE
jgi:hypothetical protein